MNIDWLQTFYIVGALVLVAFAIILYPTFRHGPREEKKSGSKH